MRAVVIAGPKKSGKTALLDLLAEVLEAKGKRVSVVKYSGHPVEKDNTDAFWLMRSGRTVVNVSPAETAIFWPECLEFDTIVSQLKGDVLLIEGGETVPGGVPRVLCFREEEESAGYWKAGEYPLLAVCGFYSEQFSAPHFLEVGPAAAEEIAALILEKGLAL